MTLQVSTQFKTTILAALPSIFSGGYIKVFTGGQPTTADMAETSNGGVQIGYITNNGLAPGLPGAALNLSALGPYVTNGLLENWVLTPVLAGTANWFRFVAGSADDGSASYSFPRIDGAIGSLGSGVELTIPSTSLVPGTNYAPMGFVYTIPPII